MGALMVNLSFKGEGINNMTNAFKYDATEILQYINHLYSFIQIVLIADYQILNYSSSFMEYKQNLDEYFISLEKLTVDDAIMAKSYYSIENFSNNQSDSEKATTILLLIMRQPESYPFIYPV